MFGQVRLKVLENAFAFPGTDWTVHFSRNKESIRLWKSLEIEFGKLLELSFVLLKRHKRI